MRSFTKSACTIILLSVFSFSFTCGQTITGRVVDADNKGIPYAVLQLQDKTQGFFCDDKGNFSFAVNMDTVKGITAYCTGYEKKEISVADLHPGMRIQLRSKSISLVEVAIKAHKYKRKRAILGKKHLKPFGQLYNNIGKEAGVFLGPPSHQRGLLQYVYVYILDIGLPAAKFRIHVYDIDTVTGLPLHDITDTNLVVNAGKGNEWLKIDLSNKYIPIHAGVFVTMEWLNGYGNNTDIQNRGAITFQGQVWGLTKSYGYGNTTYVHSAFTEKWGGYDNAGLSPMVYCTYSYPVK